ncbi:hypothetical protein [Sphingomonas bacterium]|uniref:hypothetical protein n=1 Tax=Sphingomonas bacterium TaxID=1895847 RepID=UPI001575ACC0|nr:hypothetical protein [Sphingomonas bacterium]
MTVRRDQLSNLVALAVALGGGWSNAAVSGSIDHPPSARAVQPFSSAAAAKP